MKKFVIYIVIILHSISLHSEENIYKYIISNISELSKGKSTLLEYSNSSESIIYNFEYIFTTGDEKVNIIPIDTNKKSMGIILNNTNILSFAEYRSQLLALTKEYNNYYISIINQNGEIKQKKLLYSLNVPIEIEKCQLINVVSQSSYLAKIDSYLFSINFDNMGNYSLEQISDTQGTLLSLNNISGFGETEYVIIESFNNGLILNFYNHNNEFIFLSKLASYQKSKWVDLGTQLAYLSSPSDMQTFVQVIDKNTGFITSNFWINSNINLISLTNNGKYLSASFIGESDDSYKISKLNVIEDSKKEYLSEVPISKDNSEPLYLAKLDDNYLLFFTNSILVYDENLSEVGHKFYPKIRKVFDDNLEQNLSIKQIGSTIYVISDIISLKFDLEANDFWIAKRLYYDFKNYFIVIVLVLFLILFIQLFRHQRRLNKELLDLPTAGLLFVVDAVGRLSKINNLAREFIEMPERTPKRKFIRYYTRTQKSIPFAELIEKTLETKNSYNTKVTIEIDGAETEWLCKSIALRNVTGMFRGVVLSAVDITEQLERKRLSNWAQLAHDMQTNLSTIKLNAEHLDIAQSENNENRQKRIIYQVSILMQRVRDIVTVGRSDKLNLESCNSYELCEAVRNEFDILMFPNVGFEITADSFTMVCDRPKLLRAVRNAVENGIKSMKGKPGKIKIAAFRELNNYVISIEDNGAGMDEDVKKKMLTPYFTTAAKSGGSGIGTMIMQHVLEQHNGKIVVNSEKGKGTQILFYIPFQKVNK